MSAPAAPGWRSADELAGRLAIDGCRPRFLARPTSATELAEILALAAAEHLAVVPLGGGTRLGLGNPPRAYDLALSTAGLARVVEYAPANLTVTVEAGLPLAALQAVLAEHGQHLPLDPSLGPPPETGTDPGWTPASILSPDLSPARGEELPSRDVLNSSSRTEYGVGQSALPSQGAEIASSRAGKPAEAEPSARARGLGEPRLDVSAVVRESASELPFASGSTLGGIVAANAFGPRRLGFGGVRDLLIGTRVATAGGQLARAGGKVVKNVAGYDLNKLYVGSLGTLGVLVELTFKVAPLPETERTVVARFADATLAAAALGKMLRSTVQPQAAVVLDAATAELIGLGAGGSAGAADRGNGPSWTLAVLAAGDASTTTRQSADLARLASEGSGGSVEVLADERSFWTVVANLAADATPCVRWRATVPPASLPEALTALERASRSLDAPAWRWALGGLGVAYAVWPAGVASGSLAPLAADALATAREELAALGGTLTVEAAPPELKRLADVWGDPGDALPAMRALKARFDPESMLSPGRFVGGI